MTATGTPTENSRPHNHCKTYEPGYQTITPYLTVKRAEQLVEFVKAGVWR